MKKIASWKVMSMVLIVIPVALFGLVSWYQNSFDKLPVYGKSESVKGKVQAHTVEDFALQNQDGKQFSSNELNNKIVVANFFFTSCISVCPRMMKQVITVQKTFISNPEIAIVSFSVDPETDNPERLKWYAKQIGINAAQWNLLTGNKKEIYKMARNSFFLTASDGDGGAADFIHSDQLVLVDKQKRIRGYYTGVDKTSVEQLIHDIKKLEDEK
jgi:protein SCO1/2